MHDGKRSVPHCVHEEDLRQYYLLSVHSVGGLEGVPPQSVRESWNSRVPSVVFLLTLVFLLNRNFNGIFTTSASFSCGVLLSLPGKHRVHEP